MSNSSNSTSPLLARAVHAAIHDPQNRPPPPPNDERFIVCAASGVTGCEAPIPAARIFCQACTNELRPFWLERLQKAFQDGEPVAAKRKIILDAVSSLRRKKPGR